MIKFGRVQILIEQESQGAEQHETFIAGDRNGHKIVQDIIKTIPKKTADKKTPGHLIVACSVHGTENMLIVFLSEGHDHLKSGVLGMTLNCISSSWFFREYEINNNLH